MNKSLKQYRKTEATIFVTAQIFNAQDLVKATDITPPYPEIPSSSAYLSLNGGENVTFTIYSATGHQRTLTTSSQSQNALEPFTPVESQKCQRIFPC